MKRTNRVAFALLIPMLLLPTVVNAHFLWLVRHVDKDTGAQLHLYFGELAEPDDPDLLDRVADAAVWQIDANGETKRLNLEKGSESMQAKLGDAPKNSMFVLQRDLGVIERGGESFLLRYARRPRQRSGDWDVWTTVSKAISKSVSSNNTKYGNLWTRRYRTPSSISGCRLGSSRIASTANRTASQNASPNPLLRLSYQLAASITSQLNSG